MDQKLKQEKLKMWQGKLKELEGELEVSVKEKGEAASMGDLSENAAYKMAVEEIETLNVRIEEIRKIIQALEE